MKIDSSNFRIHKTTPEVLVKSGNHSTSQENSIPTLPLGALAMSPWTLGMTLPIGIFFTAYSVIQSSFYNYSNGHGVIDSVGSALKGASLISFNYISCTAYTERTKEILSKQNILEFMNELSTHSQKEIHIWNLAEKFQTEEVSAVEMIALLFSDVSGGFNSDYFLGEYGKKIIDLRIALKENKNIHWYPDIEIPYRGASYHYYIPRYVTELALKDGVIPETAGSFALALNTEYEFLSNIVYENSWKNDGAILDIYLGYKGVLDALKKPSMPFEDFKKLCLSSSQSTVRKFIRSSLQS